MQVLWSLLKIRNIRKGEASCELLHSFLKITQNLWRNVDLEFPRSKRVGIPGRVTSWNHKLSFLRERAPWWNQVGPERSVISQTGSGESHCLEGRCLISTIGVPYPEKDRRGTLKWVEASITVANFARLWAYSYRLPWTPFALFGCRREEIMELTSLTYDFHCNFTLKPRKPLSKLKDWREKSPNE